MSIYTDLDITEVGFDEELYIKNKLINFTTLTEALSECTKATQVLGFLKTEITTLNRPSYIHRIYGRYRVLSSERDIQLIFQWRDDFERKNNRRLSNRTNN